MTITTTRIAAKGLRMVARTLCAVMLLAFASAPGLAAEPAETPISYDKKSDGDFTGVVVVTDRLDWFETWKTSGQADLTARDRFAVGESGAVAIGFSGAEETGGRFRVACSAVVIDVTGEEKTLGSSLCYDGPSMAPDVLIPASLNLKFKISEKDVPGLVTLKIMLDDLHSGRKVAPVVYFFQGVEL